MAQETLVSVQIKAGHDFIELLDEEGFSVQRASWIYYPDLEEWKLLIGTDRTSKDLTAAYFDAATWLSADGELDRRIKRSEIKSVAPDDPFLHSLAKVMPFEGRGKIRFTHNIVHGAYIDDAFV